MPEIEHEEPHEHRHCKCADEIDEQCSIEVVTAAHRSLRKVHSARQWYAESVRSKPALEVIGTVIVALAVLFAVDVGIFRSPAYRAILTPNSSTGTFERALRTVDARANDRARSVLVLGDSRMLAAFSPGEADARARGLTFMSAAVEGTDPRVWFYFLRAVDPNGRRFHAVVIPLDDYNDDARSLGAGDAANHLNDLYYVIFRLRESDAIDFAWSFDFLPSKRAALEAGVLHAFALRRDLYALLQNPLGRRHTLAADAAVMHRTDDNYPGRPGTLQGLRVDQNGEIVGMEHVPGPDREPLLQRVMRPAEYSPSYAAYRRRWLGKIAERYRSSPTKLVFVRIPAAPLVVRRDPQDRNAVAYTLARSGSVVLLPADLFDNLEQPQYFSDHDHLNNSARLIFSAALGRRIAAL